MTFAKDFLPVCLKNKHPSSIPPHSLSLSLFVFLSFSVIDTYRQASYVVGLASVMMSALNLEWLLDNGYSHVGQALVIISLLAAIFIGSHGEGWIDWVNRWAEELGWRDEDVILKDPWALSGKCFFLSSWNGIVFLQTDWGKGMMGWPSFHTQSLNHSSSPQ